MWLFFTLEKKIQFQLVYFLFPIIQSRRARIDISRTGSGQKQKKCNNKIESIFVLAIKIPDTIANRNSNWKAKAKILQEIWFNQKKEKRYFFVNVLN
jgi:hypothetical protein